MKKEAQSRYFASSVILFCILLFITISHFLFGVVLPYSRSALFLFPLVCMNLVYFAEYLKLKSFLLIGIGILLAINFCKTINLSRTLYYSAQENTKEMFDVIDSMHLKNVFLGRATYGVYINYYEQTEGLKYHFRGIYTGGIKCSGDTGYVLYSKADRYVLPSCFTADTVLKSKAGNLALLKLQNPVR